MEKLKPGLQKAELLIELLSKVFFISGTIQGECRLVCSRVQMARPTAIERKRERLGRGGEETDRQIGTERGREGERERDLPLAVFSVHGGRSGL